VDKHGSVWNEDEGSNLLYSKIFLGFFFIFKKTEL
jgi:hypothetical protein